MEAAGLSVALVTLPVSIVQAAREIKDMINSFHNAPRELNGLATELDSLLGSAARVDALAALGKDGGILSEREVRRWNQSVEHLVRIIERLQADMRRLEKRNLQN